MGKVVTMKGRGKAKSVVVHQPALPEWEEYDNPPGMKIFVASTGRCGTLFMSEVMRKIAKIPAFHEPVPWCVGRTCEDINDNPPEKWAQSTISELEDKLRRIKADAVNGWHFESNQMFIKSYWQVFDPSKIGVIYLYRNPIEVTLSYAKKCRRLEGDWFLKSHWRRNHLKTNEPLSFHENSMWQWYEIRERYYRMKHLFKKTFEFDFRKLNDPAEWRKMLAHFEIPHIDFDELPVVKKNNIDWKREAVLDMVLDEWDTPAEPLEVPTADYEYRVQQIEEAKRMIALNSAEVNRA